MLQPRMGMMSGLSMALPPSDTLDVSTAVPVVSTTPTKTGTPKGMMTGGPVEVMSTVKEETPEEMTFTFVKGKERGDAAQTYLYGQTGEVQQLTVDELRDYFESDEVNRLPEVFGTFDNYLAYMTEREQMIQSGDYDTGNWAESTGLSEEDELILDPDFDVWVPESDSGNYSAQLESDKLSSQQAAYNNWINSDANQALLEKYGVSSTVYSETGDKFQWNGSAYVKTQDEDKVTMGDYAKMAMGVAIGAFAGPAIGNALTGATGAATGAATGTTAGATAGAATGAATGATTAAAATTGSTFLQGALNSTIGSALSQGIATGSVDAKQLATAGIIGGISGVADAIKAGELTGTAADKAINNLATSTGLSVKETTNIVEGVLTGAVSGGDVEDIALNAVQQYTTGQVQNLVEETLGAWIEVPNLFDDDSTFISTEDLSPFIDTAVNAVFEGNLQAEDVLGAIGDYVGKGGTLRFLDPTRGDFDLDPDLFGLPESLRRIGRETEDFVRAVGSEFDDEVIQRARPIARAIDENVVQPVYQNVVRPLDDAVVQPIYENVVRPLDDAIIRPVGQVLSEAETAVRRTLEEIELPDGPDINLPKGPNINLPNIGVPQVAQGGMLGGASKFTPYQHQSLQFNPTIYQAPQTQKKDYVAELDNLISRGMLRA